MNKVLLTFFIMLVATVSFGFDSPKFEMFIGTGIGDYSGDVKFNSKGDSLINPSFGIDLKDGNLDNKFETLSKLSVDYCPNWGVYAEANSLEFETEEIQSQGSLLFFALGSEKAENPVLIISAMSYGLQKKILDTSKFNLYLGAGYKGLQVKISQSAEILATYGDDIMFDTVNIRLKGKLKVNDKFLINASGNYGYGTNAGETYGGDINLTYGKFIFGVIGASIEYMDVKRGSTLLNGIMKQYYAGVGFRY